MFPIVFSGGSEKTLTQEEKAVNILYKLSIFQKKYCIATNTLTTVTKKWCAMNTLL